MGFARLSNLADVAKAYANGEPLLVKGGRISAIGPDYFKVSGLQKDVSVNTMVSFQTAFGKGFGRVVRVDRDDTLVTPFRDIAALKVGDPVFCHEGFEITPSDFWLGRVLNALGEPIDGRGSIKEDRSGSEPAVTERIPAMQRTRVSSPLRTGIRAIDIFTPICYGQRLGIFAGSGVGKSTLMGMLAKADAFDCVVIALVGERGREVREFMEDSIGAKALHKTVAIVTTSDESALMRLSAPHLAMRVAEYFRNKGLRVLLLLDSITRFAHALREVAGNAGEPPIARGYPASVFAELPKLLECAGPGDIDGGSTTAVVTVLVDGDDHNDPIADAVRGILDGHIVLDRQIANDGRYPPIDLLASLSRLAPRVWTPDERKLVSQLKSLISRFEETRDLRMLGSLKAGEDEVLDRAILTVPLIYSGLVQSPDTALSPDAFADLLKHIKLTQARESHAQEADKP